MNTQTPGLDIIQKRLKAAARERRGNLLVISAVGIEIQRMRADVHAGRETEDRLMLDAATLLGAALSTPYRPLPE